MLKKVKAWVALLIGFIWSYRLHKKKTYRGKMGPIRKGTKAINWELLVLGQIHCSSLVLRLLLKREVLSIYEQ